MSNEIITEKSFQLTVNGQGFNITVKNPSEAKAKELQEWLVGTQTEYVERIIAAYLDVPLEKAKEPPFNIPQVRVKIMQAIGEISGERAPEPENPLESKAALGRLQMKPEIRKKRIADMMRTEIPGATRRAVEEG